jgi:quercetin dioxygenase-like cupin family protein
MKEGDSFFVAPHVEHGAVCIEEGILIDTFSPYREDFVKDKV